MNRKRFFYAACVVLAFRSEAFAQDSLKTIGPEAFSVLQRMHGYDKELPLEPNVDATRDWAEANGTLERIVFTTFDGTRVPLTLIFPKGRKQPAPCVLLLHGLGENQDEWFSTEDKSRLAFAKCLVTSGIAVAAIDARNHGKRNHQFGHQWPVRIATKNLVYTYQEMAISTVIDYRRLMDYLETREEIDQERFGALGISMGGMFTFELVGVEDRIKAAVSCVPPTPKWDWVVGTHYFAPYIEDCPVQILMGRDDPFTTVSEARELHSMLATKKKNIIFYDAGHQLPEKATDDALGWLTAHLKWRADDQKIP